MYNSSECKNMVSIVIPVFNREKTIKRCIESVINQTYTNLDIILVDDASTDCTVGIINQYVSVDKRIRLIKLKENGGVGKARNEGIKAFFDSDSEYLVFVDSDDFIHPRFVELLYGIAVQKKADIVSCGRFHNILDTINFDDIPDDFEIKEFDSDEGFTYDPKHLLCRIINKKCFIDKEENSLFLCGELRCSEEFALLYKLYINSSKTIHINVPLYYFCHDVSHITGGGFYNDSELVFMTESTAKAVDEIAQSGYRKIYEWYVDFFGSQLFLALTKNNMDTYRKEFGFIFEIVKKHGLEDYFYNYNITRIETNSKNQLKNDFKINFPKNKIKTVLWYIKQLIFIKKHSMTYRKLYKSCLKSF